MSIRYGKIMCNCKKYNKSFSTEDLLICSLMYRVKWAWVFASYLKQIGTAVIKYHT